MYIPKTTTANVNDLSCILFCAKKGEDRESSIATQQRLSRNVCETCQLPSQGRWWVSGERAGATFSGCRVQALQGANLYLLPSGLKVQTTHLLHLEHVMCVAGFGGWHEPV